MQKFSLPYLSYEGSDLEPYISAKTFEVHYYKHHQTYIDNLNKLLSEKGWLEDTLESIILKAHKDEDAPVFNNAGQTWNHNFYWHSITPPSKQQKIEDSAPVLLEQIKKDFGSLNSFREEFIKTGLAQFGSGWVWLVWDDKENKLKITKTANADCPMTHSQNALITSDVWEHAYYLDYQNKRKDYLEQFIDHLIHWKFGENNFTQVLTK